jgi:hypothetical protein
MELEWLKESLNGSDARVQHKLVDHDHPELTVSRQCKRSGCHDRPSTRSPCLSMSPPCGSWPGSMPCTWRIPARVAGERCTTWTEKESPSAVTVSEIPCSAWVYGRSIRDKGRQFLVAHPSVFPAWWTSGSSWPQMRSGRRI